MTEKFFGYKHWTLEEIPRCFNVGKGVLGREKSKRSRNHKWHAIVKRYGLRVEVCVGPMTNEDVIVWEIENIGLMNTFSTCHDHDNVNDIGCNFTKGGEGSAGCFPSLETREKMRQSHLGNDGGRDSLLGKPKTAEHRRAISVALKKNPKVSAALMGNQRTLGYKFTQAQIKKRSLTLHLNNQRRKLLRLFLEKSL